MVLDFRMGRAREGPKLFLDKYEGLLQTDGYTAYDGVGGKQIVHAACWAREQKLTHADRNHMRQQETAPLLGALHQDLKLARQQALPASATGKAADYALNLWHKLTRFLEHPELELSTNLAENSMRPIALGRKNWIHLGSQNAGPKVAAILSVLESCRRLRINPREYLADILPGLAKTSIHSLHTLTPNNWAAEAT